VSLVFKCPHCDFQTSVIDEGVAHPQVCPALEAGNVVPKDDSAGLEESGPPTSSLYDQFLRWSKSRYQSVPSSILWSAYDAGARAVAANPCRDRVMALWRSYIVSHTRYADESPEDHADRIAIAAGQFEAGIQGLCAEKRDVPVAATARPEPDDLARCNVAAFEALVEGTSKPEPTIPAAKLKELLAKWDKQVGLTAAMCEDDIHNLLSVGGEE
jgi:hypothetical protein